MTTSVLLEHTFYWKQKNEFLVNKSHESFRCESVFQNTISFILLYASVSVHDGLVPWHNFLSWNNY